MHRILLLTAYVLLGLFTFVSVYGQTEASIFETRERFRGARPFRSIPAPMGNHRHINSLALPDPEEIEKLRRDMNERLRKYNEEDSNERLLWRSHPINANFEGPDTTEAVGIKF